MSDENENELKLRRYIYLSNEELCYVSGDPFVHKYYTIENIKSIENLINSNKINEVTSIISKASLDKYLPQKDPLIFALAVCARSKDVKLQICAYESIQNVCKTVDQLLLFIKFYTGVSQHKGFGMGFRKCINKWYFDMNALKLAEIVTESRAKHGWLHKDVFKMTHPKPVLGAKSMILHYVKFGYKDTMNKFKDDNDVREILTFIEKVETFKHCEDPQEIQKSIKSNKFSINYLPAHFHKIPEAIQAAIPHSDMRIIISSLARFHSLGYLKQNSLISQAIITFLTDPKQIESSKIHPIEVFIGLHNYLNGGKYPDHKKIDYFKSLEEKKEENAKDKDKDKERDKEKENLSTKKEVVLDPRPKIKPNPSIVNALNKLLYLSFKNQTTTGTRYMITMDVRQHMIDERCFKCGNIKAIKAAVFLALYLVKTEKEVIVAVFNERGVHTVQIEKTMTLNQAEQKVLEGQSGNVQFNKPLEWAIFKKKRIDVFINVFHSPRVVTMLPKELRTASMNVKGSLENYRKKMKLANTKLISICLCKHNLDLGRSTSSSGLLDICGLNQYVPKIIEAFVKGSFK